MSHLNRRNFLIGSIGGAGALISLGFLGRKFFPASSLDQATNRFLVVLGVPHAMDCTLGLDPQTHGSRLDDKDIFLEYSPEEILKSDGILFGPAAASLLPHARDIAVVQGVHCFEDLGHKRSYLVSGMYPGRHGNLAAQFNEHRDRTPFGVLTNATFSLGNSAGLVTDLPNLSQQFLHQNESLALPGLESALGPELSPLVEKINRADGKTAELYRQLAQQGKWHPDFCLLAVSFVSSFASSAAIGLDNYIKASNMDSHENHAGNHLQAQRETWDQVASLFSLFKSVPYGNGTLFDRTTFVVGTEFSRTPYLNADLGKDHNLSTNSILVAGLGIRGGRTIGKSHVWSRKESIDGTAKHVGLPMNFATGETTLTPRESFDLITSENIARSILEITGGPVPESLLSYPSIRKLIES